MVITHGKGPKDVFVKAYRRVLDQYDERLDDKWERAIGKLGARAEQLSGEAGHA